MCTSMALHLWDCRGSSCATPHRQGSSTDPHSTGDVRLRTRLALTVPTVAKMPVMPMMAVRMPAMAVRMPGMPARRMERRSKVKRKVDKLNNS